MFDLDGISILFHNTPMDMRKSIDGLSIVVAESLERPPHDGTLYVFCNRKRDKIKILYWQRNGFCLWYKRLEKEKFKFPTAVDNLLKLTLQQLRWLLDGLDITDLKGHGKVSYQTYF
jgi:transposase